MNYKLIKVELNMNADQFGGRDTRTEIAISNEVETLETYCMTTFGATGHKPKKFAYEYYDIVPSTTLIMFK